MGITLYLGVLVVRHPDPSSLTLDIARAEVVSVPASLSYRQVINEPVALTTPLRGAGGFVYVPQPASDCAAEAISSNVSRRNDIPAGLKLIALAPRGNKSCSFAYLDQAQEDGASALVYYEWQENESFDSKSVAIPVYQVGAIDGRRILDALVTYHGSMSLVPYSEKLLQLFGSRDYARVSMEIEVIEVTTFPGFWLFLLIVIAVLCTVVGLISLSMHFVQWYRRRSLLQRIEAGTTNLEMLGIKRITVPQGILDKIPIRIYEPLAQPTDMRRMSGYNQQSCAICLDEFTASQTQVRELPCLHIYHPECIDSFLMQRSSLCPLCKQSTLPRGYLPPSFRITSSTVARERRYRRRHERQRSRQNGMFLWGPRRRPMSEQAETRHDSFEPDEGEPRSTNRMKRFINRIFPVS